VTTRRALVLILVVAGALRLAWGVSTLDEFPETWQEGGDQFSYWYYGNEIADGNGYVGYVTDEATSYYPIGYPATLAAVFWLQEHTPIPDHKPTGVAVFHALLATASVLFVFLIARAALGERAGLVAAGVTALTANLVLYVASYALETTFVFWALAALAVLVTHDWSKGPPSWSRVFAFGCVLAIAGMVRPFCMPFLAVLFIGVLLTKAGWKRALLSVGLAILPFIALVVPWTIRNYQALDAFVPISTNLGDTACMDRSMSSRGGFAWAAHEGCAAPDLPEAERSRENLSKAIDFVVTHPTKEIELWWLRFGKMVEHGHAGLGETEGIHGQWLDDGERDLIIRIADWTFWITGVLGTIGLLSLIRRGDRATLVPRLAILVPSGILLAIPLLLWGNPRFHVPLLPFLAIGTAAVPGVITSLAGKETSPWNRSSTSPPTSSSEAATA
jgi:4-amino-4-deoxy-L-arabinose transferase-like glycosyltransferase